MFWSNRLAIRVSGATLVDRGEGSIVYDPIGGGFNGVQYRKQTENLSVRRVLVLNPNTRDKAHWMSVIERR